MASNVKELSVDFSPYMKIYKDGSVERFLGLEILPPSTDPETGIESKDVTISAEKSISARLYIPTKTTENHLETRKLPLLVYFHGGGFCIETPFSPLYHNYLNAVVSESNVVAVSVHYRRAPEHPIPIPFEDSWQSLKWVASHSDGTGPDEWLNRYADLGRVFLAGDSAGANMTHHMAIRVGSEGLDGIIKLKGIILAHPWFLGVEPIGDELKFDVEFREKIALFWRLANPNTSGSDDPLINPDKDPKAGGLGCEKVLVTVAEKDYLKDRGWFYKEVLKTKGFGGVVEAIEHKGEELDHDHVFHLFNPTCRNAMDMLKKIAEFINQDG